MIPLTYGGHTFAYHFVRGGDRGAGSGPSASSGRGPAPGAPDVGGARDDDAAGPHASAERVHHPQEVAVAIELPLRRVVAPPIAPATVPRPSIVQAAGADDEPVELDGHPRVRLRGHPPGESWRRVVVLDDRADGVVARERRVVASTPVHGVRRLEPRWADRVTFVDRPPLVRTSEREAIRDRVALDLDRPAVAPGVRPQPPAAEIVIPERFEAATALSHLLLVGHRSKVEMVAARNERPPSTGPPLEAIPAGVQRQLVVAPEAALR